MYDTPMLVGSHSMECPECKKIEAKKQELNSRYSSLSWTASDYDNKKGKGAFKKDFAEADKLMDSILKEKTALVVNHEFQHAAHEMKEEPEEEELEQETGVPII